MNPNTPGTFVHTCKYTRSRVRHFSIVRNFLFIFRSEHYSRPTDNYYPYNNLPFNTIITVSSFHSIRIIIDYVQTEDTFVKRRQLFGVADDIRIVERNNDDNNNIVRSWRSFRV